MMINAEDIHKAKILVVDDSADNANILADLLIALGYQQVTATTQPQRVTALHEEHAYDLILLDMHMPGLNGLDVMLSLKQVEKDPYLPVLAITGDSEYEVQALKSGARDFLTKPVDLFQLEARVHNLIEMRLLYKALQEASRIQKEMATHDTLTGLPNRRLLWDRAEKSMQHAFRSGNRMAIMYVDLDGFKTVNDTYGHGGGDVLLQMVAKRLVEATREEDTVSRMGGDEFVILLPNIVDIDDITGPAEKVLDYLTMPFKINNATIQISASIGVSIHPDDGCSNPEALISRADQALYEAKNSGKNRYCINNFPRADYVAGRAIN